MKDPEKRQAVAAYKELKTAAGVYVLRCAATGEAWVGSAANLATLGNRLWFGLRLGTSPHRSLQAAWSAHGEAQFTLETLETLDDKDKGPLQTSLLKTRAAQWQARLGAYRL